jgi:hypothetical protein
MNELQDKKNRIKELLAENNELFNNLINNFFLINPEEEAPIITKLINNLEEIFSMMNEARALRANQSQETRNTFPPPPIFRKNDFREN